MPYQPGVAALYRELAVPLVPAAVNSGLYWGRRAFFKRGGRIVVEFLAPIPPGLPRREVMATLEGRIEAATAALEREAGCVSVVISGQAAIKPASASITPGASGSLGSK